MRPSIKCRPRARRSEPAALRTTMVDIAARGRTRACRSGRGAQSSAPAARPTKSVQSTRECGAGCAGPGVPPRSPFPLYHQLLNDFEDRRGDNRGRAPPCATSQKAMNDKQRRSVSFSEGRDTRRTQTGRKVVRRTLVAGLLTVVIVVSAPVILAYPDTRMTNGPVEGINNKLRVIARRAYGFHSPGPLISMLYLCCGGIQLASPLPTRV